MYFGAFFELLIFLLECEMIHPQNELGFVFEVDFDFYGHIPNFKHDPIQEILFDCFVYEGDIGPGGVQRIEKFLGEVCDQPFSSLH